MRCAECCAEGLALVAQLGAQQVANVLGREHLLPAGFAFDVPALADARASIDAEAPHAGIGGILVTEAEAVLDFADVGLDVEVLAVVLELDLRRLAVLGDPRDRRFRIGDLGFQQRLVIDLPAQVDAGQLGRGACRLVVDVRHADFDAIVARLQRRTAARDDVVGIGRYRLVFGDDEHRVEVEIAARHRLLEVDRAAQRIEVVVEEAAQRRAAEHDTAVEAVAHLDAYDVTVRDDRRIAQLVQPGRAVAANLVAIELLVRLRSKYRVAGVVAAEFRLEAVEAAFVTCEFGHRQPRVVVAEQCVKNVALELHVQLALAGGFETLFRRVAIERVVAIRIDDGFEGAAVAFTVAVVRERQQVLAPDLALGEERDAPLVRILVLETGRHRRIDVIRQRVVGRRAFGEADQDPVAWCRLDPGSNLLLAVVLEIECQRDLARARRRLQLDQRDAALPDLVGRLARAELHELVAAVVLDLPPRTVRRRDPEAAAHAGTRRVVAAVEQPDRDDRPGLAIGDQRRLLGHELAAYRQARVVNLARYRACVAAVGVRDDSANDVFAVDEIDAFPARYRDAAGTVGRNAFERDRARGAAVDPHGHRLRRRVLDRDLGGRYRRIVALGRQQHRYARRQGVDVWLDLRRHRTGLGPGILRAFAVQALGARHRAAGFDDLRAARRLRHLEVRGLAGPHAAEHHLDAAIGLPACPRRVVGDRFVGAAALRLHVPRRNTECRCDIVGRGIGAGARQRVVIGKQVLVRRRDRLAVAVADRRNPDILHALPVLDEQVEFELVLGRQLGRQDIELEIEHITFVLDQARLANHDRLRDRRGLAELDRRIELRDGARRLFAADVTLDVRRELDVRRPVAHAIRQRHRDDLLAHAWVALEFAVDLHRAAFVAVAVGQHDHDVDVRDVDIADAVDRQVIGDLVGAAGALVAQLEVDSTFGGRLAAQVEIGALQSAGVELDELRRGAAGVPGRRAAADDVEIGRHRECIELCNVGARFDAFEVEAAALVGDRVAAVFEIDADVRDTLLLGERLLAAVGIENAADDRSRAAEQVFGEANQRRRLVRNEAVVRERRGAVHDFVATLAADDLDDVVQDNALGDRERRQVERQCA